MEKTKYMAEVFKRLDVIEEVLDNRIEKMGVELANLTNLDLKKLCNPKLRKKKLWKGVL